jgi:hypothetical protein
MGSRDVSGHPVRRAGADPRDHVPAALELLLPRSLVMRARACLRELGIGRHPLCKPRGSGPRVGAFALPFCWRCSGILAGALAAELAARLAGAEPPAASLAGAALLLALPAAADVGVQSASSYTSSARTRLVTGTLLGVAASAASRCLANVLSHALE